MIELAGLISIVFLSIVVIVLCVIFLSSLRARVPFIPVPLKTLESIEGALGVDESSVVYDLGCGDARVLLYLSTIHKGATYKGIENALFPRTLARISSWIYRIRNKGNVEIIFKDFFKLDLSDATHIFVYLYPVVMDELLPKLERELRPGTRLVSATFVFSNKEPSKVVSVSSRKNDLVKELYVYEF